MKIEQKYNTVSFFQSNILVGGMESTEVCLIIISIFALVDYVIVDLSITVNKKLFGFIM